MITDRTNAERYSRILKRYENEVRELDFRVEILQTPNETLLKQKLHYAILLINNAVMYIRDAPVDVKMKLIGSMFPEKLSFDGKIYRTKKMNRVLDLIYQQTRELRGYKKRNKTNENSSVLFSAPNRVVLEPILCDLEKLWELRFWIPNPGEPISPQSFHASD